MNKTAIKNFAIWARNKLIADIKYKAGLLGITDKAIKSPLPQSTNDVQFFDIGTKEPYSIYGIEMDQALMAITINPSKVLGLPLKGHLKIGNDADIVLLESDTLEISGVISRGRIMMLAKELKCRDTFE